IVVNSQDESSRRLHPLLAQRLSESITLYGQEPETPDVWQIANVAKDDFQIYDRCGRLTHHLSLPYTILSQPYVEDAIRRTYCDGICGECTMEVNHSTACASFVKYNQAEEGEAGHSHSPGIGHGHHSHHGGHHGGHHGHQRGQHRGHHGSGGTHSHDDSDHQHGHQGQVVVSQVQRGQVDLGHPQVAHKHVDLGQVDLGLVFDQVEARNPLAMQQP
uniref:Selenoprotein P N-terminal domain-containing protein n=1 Tax=Pygocentrus nattereri TaxID=42514 RepID=A0A3B4EDL7_PYGNA